MNHNDIPIKKAMEELQKEIGIYFHKPELLEEALTHSSYAKRQKSTAKKKYNERLEFFGDSVLKLIITEYLFHEHPDYTEGQLSKLRSKMISDRFLAQIAKQIHLGRYLKMSYGELKSGSQDRLSFLANAFEALLGACYLDQGLDVTRSFFFRIWDDVQVVLNIDDFSDFKTALQEKCQKFKVDLPMYRIIKEVGPDHEKVFHVEASVEVDDTVMISQGDADTKKQAEQAAARKILDVMKHYIHQ